MLFKEKGELASDEKQLVSIINKFFINITINLKLKEDQSGPPVILDDILEKFIFHPSIDKIRKTYESHRKFSFQQVTEEHVRQVILSIDGSKATPVGDVPADMLKVTLDIHLSLITKIINLSFENGCFPDDLKLAEVSPIFKKNDDLDKENYRPVSVLFNVSKVFERIITAKLMRLCKINCQILEKTIVHSIVLCTCLKIGKIWWIKRDMYVLCSWTYQRLLKQYIMI